MGDKPSGWVNSGDESNFDEDKLNKEVEKVNYSDSEMEKWIEAAQNQPFSEWCASLYGVDGTGKSGVAIDSRTKEDIKNGKKVWCIDLDRSCSPLKRKYYKNDPNIIVLDPHEVTSDHDFDYIATYAKTKAIVNYIQRKELANTKTVILDGLDTLLKVCEHVMRIEDLKISPDTQIKNSWDWGKRNRRYLTILFMVKSLPCNRFFVTHMKDIKRWINDELEIVDRKTDWYAGTPGHMYQSIKCEKVDKTDTVEFIATFEKSKTDITLENKKFLIAKVSKQNTEWYGLDLLKKG